MNILKSIDYKISILAVVQLIGSYQGISKIIEIGFFNMGFGIGNLIILPYLLLSLLGILSTWFLLKNDTIGLILAKFHFALQVPYFEIQKFLYEYYTSVSIRLYVGEPRTGFDFLTGSTYRIGINYDNDFWAIGVNIAPILFFYFIFRIEETMINNKANTDPNTKI